MTTSVRKPDDNLPPRFAVNETDTRIARDEESTGGQSRGAEPVISGVENATSVKPPTSGSVAVLVVDENSDPVTEAWVEVRNATQTAYQQADRQGRCFLDGLELGRYNIDARRYDFSWGGKEVELSAETPNRELTLIVSPAHYVQGTAYLYDRSTPLGNREMELIHSPLEDPYLLGPNPDDIVSTDEDGRFIVGPFQDNDDGEDFFQLRYQTFRVETVVVDPAKSPRAIDVEVVFTPGGAAGGYVTNADGAPASGVEVRWQRQDTKEDFRLRATTDETGRYEVRGLRPAKYYVSLGAPGYEAEPPKEVIFPDAAYLEVPLDVNCVPVVEIRLETVDGVPVPDARLMVSYATSNFRREGVVRTDTEGVVRLTCVRRGILLSVGPREPKYRFARATVNTADLVGPILLELLPPFGTTEGKVVDEEGRGVPDILVVATTYESMEAAGENLTSIRRERTRTDAGGAFRLDLQPGTYRIEAVSAEHGGAVIEEFEVSESAVDLLLELGSTPVLRARVVREDGQPVEGAEVGFYPYQPRMLLSGLMLSGRTDANGRFVALGPEALYQVWATWKDFESDRVSGISSGDPTVVLKLKPNPSFSGLVLDDGVPSPGAEVGYCSASGYSYGGGGVTDDQGRFSIRIPRSYLQSGPVYLYARGEGFALTEAVRIELSTPATEGVLLESLPGQDFAGKLRRPEGGPVREAQVRLHRTRVPQLEVEAVSDQAGWIRIQNLPLGRYEVMARSAR